MAELQFAEGGIAEEEDFFAVIDQLISHGIDAGDVKNLQNAGIISYTDLMTQTKENLTKITELPGDKVDRIREAAEKIVNFGYISGSEALLSALQYCSIIEERGPLLRRNSVILITTENQAQLLNGGIETFKIIGMLGEFSCGNTQLACTERVSTECAGHQLVSFLSGFPTIGDRQFLIATHVGSSVADIEKFAMKFASTSEIKSFITSLEKKIIIFVDREQLYFNQFAQVEFDDYKFTQQMVDYWKKEAKKGTSHYEGTTAESIKSAKKEVGFWASLHDRAKKMLQKIARNWDPNPSEFSFVLRNTNDRKAVSHLRKEGVWKGTEVLSHNCVTKTDKDAIESSETEVAATKRT